MSKKVTSYSFKTRKNLMFDYLEHGDHPYDIFFVVGDSRTMIGCHKLILSLHSNNQMLFNDSSMDTIILPDFSPSTLNSLVRYFYCGETYIADMTSLTEFLSLCEIFKLNVKGLEVEQLKGAEIEESLIEEENLIQQNDQNQTEEMLNTEEIEEIIDEVNVLDEVESEDYVENVVTKDEEIHIEPRRKIRVEDNSKYCQNEQETSRNYKKSQQTSDEPASKRSKTR